MVGGLCSLPDARTAGSASTRQAADGTGPVDLLVMSETAGFFRPYSWSPDGKTLVFDYAAPMETAISGMSVDGGCAPLEATASDAGQRGQSRAFARRRMDSLYLESDRPA